MPSLRLDERVVRSVPGPELGKEMLMQGRTFPRCSRLVSESVVYGAANLR